MKKKKDQVVIIADKLINSLPRKYNLSLEAIKPNNITISIRILIVLVIITLSVPMDKKKLQPLKHKI